METMDEYKEAVDELVLGRNGLVVHSIHFGTVDVLKLGEKEKLQSVSLGHHEHVAFKVSNYYPNKSKLNKNDNDDNIRGCTLCIKTPEGIKQVVFIRESQHRPEFFKGGMDGYENQKLFDFPVFFARSFFL